MDVCRGSLEWGNNVKRDDLGLAKKEENMVMEELRGLGRGLIHFYTW